jgi:Tfp pilus assembly protein PilF
MRGRTWIGFVVLALVMSTGSSESWARGRHPGVRLGGHTFGPARHPVGYANPWVHRPSWGHGIRHGHYYGPKIYHHYRPSYHHNYRPQPYRPHYYRPHYYHHGFHHHRYHWGAGSWPYPQFSYAIGSPYGWSPAFYSSYTYGGFPTCVYPIGGNVTEFIDLRLTDVGAFDSWPIGAADRAIHEDLIDSVPLMLDATRLTRIEPIHASGSSWGESKRVDSDPRLRDRIATSEKAVTRDDPPLVLTSARSSPRASQLAPASMSDVSRSLAAGGRVDDWRLSLNDAADVGTLRVLEGIPDESLGRADRAAPAVAMESEILEVEQERGVQLMIDLGDRLFRSGSYRQAANQYRSAVLTVPRHAGAHLRHAYSLVALGQYDEAAGSLRQSLRLQPQLVSSDFRSHSLYGDRSSATAHIEALAGAALREPQNADLLLLIGTWLHFEGDQTRAKRFLDRSSQLSAEHAHLVSQWRAG